MVIDVQMNLANLIVSVEGGGIRYKRVIRFQRCSDVEASDKVLQTPLSGELHRIGIVQIAMPQKTKQIGHLTLKQKKRTCIWKDYKLAMTQAALAKKAQHEFVLLIHPAQGTISSILMHRNRFLNLRDGDKQIKCSRAVMFPQVDEALANWVLQSQVGYIMLDGGVIQEKDRCLAIKFGVADEKELSFSNGWRHGFTQCNAHGESGSVNPAQIPAILKKIRAAVQQYSLAYHGGN